MTIQCSFDDGVHVWSFLKKRNTVLLVGHDNARAHTLSPCLHEDSNEKLHSLEGKRYRAMEMGLLMTHLARRTSSVTRSQQRVPMWDVRVERQQPNPMLFMPKSAMCSSDVHVRSADDDNA